MAITLRFRPVVLGSVEQPAAVFFLTDGPDGNALFREMEFALPLTVPLEEVTLADLPEVYRVEGVTVLPVQEVQGETGAEAFQRMRAVFQVFPKAPGRAKGVA